MDDEFAALAAAIGRAVLLAAGLEKILLVDIGQRSANHANLRDGLERELRSLQRRSAGTLVAKLRALGISQDLARRLEEFIVRRNELVHHFMEGPESISALTSESFSSLIDGVDQLTAECQALINEIAPPAFAGAEGVMGVTFAELFDAAKTADLAAIEDDDLRGVVEAAARIDLDLGWHPPSG